jgi:hypothetical protein
VLPVENQPWYVSERMSMACAASDCSSFCLHWHHVDILVATGSVRSSSKCTNSVLKRWVDGSHSCLKIGSTPLTSTALLCVFVIPFMLWHHSNLWSTTVKLLYLCPSIYFVRYNFLLNLRRFSNIWRNMLAAYQFPVTFLNEECPESLRVSM